MKLISILLKRYVSAVSDMRDVLKKRVKKLLEEPQASYPLKLVRDAYKACMDTERINERKAKPLTDILTELEVWPYGPLQNPWWQPTYDNWYDLMYKMREKGLLRNAPTFGTFDAVYFVFGVFVDFKETSRHVITMDQPGASKISPGLGLPLEFLLMGENSERVRKYKEVMVELLFVFGISRHIATETADKLVKFELELAKIMKPKEERRGEESQYNLMTIRDLTNTYRNIPWMEFLTKMLDRNDLTNDDNVIVGNPDYLEKLETVLEGVDLSVQVSYIIWRTIYYLHSYLHEEALEISGNSVLN